MKYSIFLLVFSLTLNGQTTNPSIKVALTDYFNCLKTSDIKKFNNLLVKESEYKKLGKSQGIAGNSDQKIYKDFIQTSNAEFEKVIANSKQIGVNWANAVLDSVVFKTNKQKTSSLINGKIYFRLKDNSAFYWMNIINLTFSENSLLFSKQYSPTEDIGPKNRLLTKDLKEEYITNLSKLMNKGRDWAEGQYYRETDMADGVTLVKYKIAYCKKQLAKKK